jgi:transposase InsO family protein
MDERRRMIALWESGRTPTELAERFGVSRQTIYTFIERWQKEGKAGLEDRSRRPHTSPRKTAATVERALVELKEQHPDYGPDKLVALLEEAGITLAAPTARDVLRRHGLVKARRGRTPRWSPVGEPVIAASGPGQMMTTDYKGQFRLGNGKFCYPLTIADPGSRFVFAVEAMTINSGRQAKAVFERVFREWGVPDQILTDNGAPFCVSKSIGGISELSRWWTRLGIRHVRTQPGRPQQNGIHERMHRTLKQATTGPAEHTLNAQQKRFNLFMAEFNHVRPHQGLGQKRPATVVQRYRREYPERLPQIEYPESFLVRRVRSNGYIKWQGDQVFVGEVLIGEPVGLVQTDDETWQLYFGNRHLADWSDRKRRWVAPAEISEK